MDYNNWQATHISPIDETHRIEVYTNQKTGSRRFVPVYTRDGAHWHRFKNRETFRYFDSYGAAGNFLRRHSNAEF